MAADEARWAWRYQKELPADRTNLAQAWKLFELYSGIPPDQIEKHVIEVVRRLKAPFPLSSRP